MGIQDAWNEMTILETNVYLSDIVTVEAPLVEQVGPAIPPIFDPEIDVGPWHWEDSNGEDDDGQGAPEQALETPTSEDERPFNWIAPVQVLHYQHQDVFYPIWLRTDEPIEEVTASIDEYAADGSADTFVLPIQPQPFSDMLVVCLTSTWVIGLGFAPALLDISSFAAGRFLVHLMEPITIDYVKRLAGTKWHAGADIYVGFATEPLRPGEEYTSDHGILIRIHDSTRPLPPVEWIETKLRHPRDWAMDTRRQRFTPPLDGQEKVCLLGYCAPELVIDARPTDTSLSMRDRVSTICNLQPESFILKPPRGRMTDLVFCGEAAIGFLGVQPWATSDRLGVFVDGRHLGWPFQFCWQRRGSMPMAEFCRQAGIQRLHGWDVAVLGCGGYDEESDTIWCREGDVVVLHVMEFRSPAAMADGEDSAPEEVDHERSHTDDGATDSTAGDSVRPGSHSRSPRRNDGASDRIHEDITSEAACTALEEKKGITCAGKKLMHHAACLVLGIRRTDGGFNDACGRDSGGLQTARRRMCIPTPCRARGSAPSARGTPPDAPVPIFLADAVGPVCFDVERQCVRVMEAGNAESLQRLTLPWKDFELCGDFSGVQLHVNSKRALAVSDPPSIDWRADVVEIYTDGSAKNGCSGFSVVVVCQTMPAGDGVRSTRLQGYFTGKVELDASDTSYVGATHADAVHAEISAIAWAVLWGLAHRSLFPTATVAFRFDSTCAGFAACGRWTTASLRAAEKTRQLVQYCENFWGALGMKWRQTPAHKGHPWNEPLGA